MIKALAVVLALGGLAGCASSREQIAEMATRHQLIPLVVKAGAFDLYTLGPRSFVPGQPLSLYIEGDGFAWRNRYQPSDDPTPRDPVALKLALGDPGANVVYVARPCQYVTGANRRNCHPAYWTSARFAEEVIAATQVVLDHYGAKAQAGSVKLYGYSGGGAVAVLLAARRHDVVQLVTVAGVLDSDAWTAMDDSTPLFQSLNPAMVAGQVAAIPQRHLVGGDDKVVPLAVARSYGARGAANSITLISGQDHDCCWAAAWPGLLQRIQRELTAP